MRRRASIVSTSAEFPTSCTPCRPEILQDALQPLFEFQTRAALLTGMEVAKGSNYDDAAAAEAVRMAHRPAKQGRALPLGRPHPQ
jgi:glycine dehydrogenase subunit 1